MSDLVDYADLNDSSEARFNHSYDFGTFNESTSKDSNPSIQAYIAEQIFALHYPVTLRIHIVATLLWWFIGFPGNILAFSVWVQPRMRPSSGTYMAALAMTDLIFLILHVLFEFQSSWHFRTLEYPFLCQAFPIVYLSSQYFSVLLVGGFSAERYISICYPFLREKFCTTSRSLLCILILGLFPLALTVPQAYFWYYDSEKDQCGIRPEVMSQKPSVWEIWSWVTELFIFGLIPLAILILNILVLVEMRRIKAMQPPVVAQVKAPLNRTRSTTRYRTGGPSATTLMLLAVSFYLIVVTLPVTFMYVLSAAFPTGSYTLTPNETLSDPQWKRYCSFYSVRVLIQDAGLSHFALNFYIYIATGKVFRKELRRLLAKFHSDCFERCKDIFCKHKTPIYQVADSNHTRGTTVMIETVENKNEIIADALTGESIDRF